MLMALKQTIRRINWLDGVIALLLLLAGLCWPAACTSGWPISGAGMRPTCRTWPHLKQFYFFSGLLTTLRIALLGMVLALLLGTALGVAAFSRRPWLVMPG